MALPRARAQSNDPRITLAGSFNNWQTADADYALQETGVRHELVRFWRCGTYEFKFVFDGTWQRHLGDAGGGRLEQPGVNIPLRINQSGEHALWLDPQKKRWGLEPRPASKPYARIVLLRRHGPVVQLDATQSVARADHPITSYEWDVRLEDDPSLRLSLQPDPRPQRPPPGPAPTTAGAESADRPEMARPLLNVPRRGRYRIRLTVRDGTMSDRTEIREELGHGYCLMDGRYFKDRASALVMQPIRAGLWTAPYGLLKAEEVTLSVRPICEAGDGAPRATLRPRLESGRQYGAVFDETTGALSLASEGLVGFALGPEAAPTLPKDLTVERVDVAGSFNGWRPEPMFASLDLDDPYFTRVLELPEGVHHYRYLVNGVFALEDPRADPGLREPDGQGGYHSGIRVGPDPAAFGAARANHVVQAAVRHDPTSRPYCSVIGNDVVRLTVRTLKDDVEGVGVEFLPRGEPVALLKSDSRDGFDYWSANCRVRGPRPRYVFQLIDGTARALLDSSGCRTVPAEGKAPTPSSSAPFEAELRMSFETPDWAKEVVWYQIFPERFRNGDKSNDPPRTVPWTHAWFKPYRGKGTADDAIAEKGPFYSYIFDRRYGGDLQGIREKLPYLRELGITALYLNPIFLAQSLHKYDASDYRHIEDFFAVKDSLKKIKGETTDPKTWQWSQSDRLFLDLLKEARAQGFRVILDGVFNHTGRDFWAFRDVLKHGKKSAYAGWFDIESWNPFHYKAWDGPDGHLPRLKHDDALGLAEPVREHIFAITRRWMDPDGDGDPSDGIDGWRLDVAADINEHFWTAWRTLVKSINPEAYVVAELWQESKSWLDGRTFDAVMNYPFAVRAQRFFVNDKRAVKPSTMGAQLQEILGWYPPQVNYALQNLLSSHDTDRVASMFLNPDLEYDLANRLQDNGPNYNRDRPTPECYARLRAMVTFQMTFLGAPMIYYGDEVGMFGADDPTCRKPMLWKDVGSFDDPDERILDDLFEHYRRVIAIRATYPALRLGGFSVAAADDRLGVFAFARSLGNETVIVAINNSDQSRRLNVNAPWPDGSKVVRIDDPRFGEIVPPADVRARPTVRPVRVGESRLRVEDGRLRGQMLAPRTAGVFVRVDGP